ncbi:MAG: phosphoribosylformylglycinamidine synthase subunit PurQ, partial [Oscillospiraceae bacterium]|nr:phosphoribosylformylglycinamidine synthase subunit PurQ [Oscillospiraceae bacterium]
AALAAPAQAAAAPAQAALAAPAQATPAPAVPLPVTPAPNETDATPIVMTAKLYVFNGDISDGEYDKLRNYLINPVESREAQLEKPATLKTNYPEPSPVKTIDGFITSNDDSLRQYIDGYNLAMDIADLRFMQTYFRDTEARDPTEAELRVIDTYWSDHCRHTTFLTHIDDIQIDDPEIKATYDEYLNARAEVYGTAAAERPQTLMDIATIASKTLRGRGYQKNIDISEEVNACSIHIDVNVNGNSEDWLLMFKNETHNHPTEVEPFGGASTCVGGAIRDPLSGRAYVYQAMRVTGAGNPLSPIDETVPGKIPQRKLTKTAAQGNSSYGNQIGLAGGFVHEIYHPGYAAKRMELGAVVGAVKSENVCRDIPAPGDRVILVGARTGRDGIGGATGSSKSQTDKSIIKMSAEVQKGNAPEERKIQRLFLDPSVSKIIKRCNDFGAGGVSVAVGELADGLEIDLSLVRCKYDGLDGTELAISESQERMAVVVSQDNADYFIRRAEQENLEAYAIAQVTESPRMVMRHNGTVIVDLSRDFLSSNGAVKTISIRVPAQTAASMPAEGPSSMSAPLLETMKTLLSDLRFCSQRGLYEMFDGTAGALSILMKNGGKTQSTPVQVMASLLPVGFDAAQFSHAQVSSTSVPQQTVLVSAPQQAASQTPASQATPAQTPPPSTTTCSVMAYSYDPYLSEKSPYIGAKTAVINSVAKLAAAGCDPDDVFLSFQEYFENLRGEPVRWGKPFSALLGAFSAQMALNLAAIGGKDSMSGSFNDMDVPPALVSFAIAPCDAAHLLTPEFKEPGHDVVAFGLDNEPDNMKQTWKTLNKLIKDKKIASAWAITEGGIAEGAFKMCVGNNIGIEFDDGFNLDALFASFPGAIIAEVTNPVPGAALIGRTIAEPSMIMGGERISISELKTAWESTLEPIFPTKAIQSGTVATISYDSRPAIYSSEHFAKPRALIFSFPGSWGDVDAARAVRRAGGAPHILLIRNKTRGMFADSIMSALNEIKNSQILIIPAGTSLGDEPDGAAKFIDIFFRFPEMADAVLEHIKAKKGLMLGLGNGFQALLRLGLVPYGEIAAPSDHSPILAKNPIGRHHAGYAYTRVASVNSPWMINSNMGDIHAMPISACEGRLVARDDVLESMAADGRIATQYTDIFGNASMDISINPTGSLMAVEGLFSPDGHVFGKIGNTERQGDHIAKNIYGDKHQPLFESGVSYFK